MSQLIKAKLELCEYQGMFLDNYLQVILGYINSEIERLKMLVANRVQLICDNSNTIQLHFDTKSNLGDNESSGLDVINKKKIQRW